MKEILKETYNNIGKQFSASRKYIWPDIKPYLEYVADQDTVLDVGCGNGRLLLGLPENVEYLGLDFSTALLDEAINEHPHARFIETDITKSDVWSQLPMFDYIFCIAVIHHLTTRHDQLFLLSQIKKHLKPNGKCLITAWNLWQPKLLKHHFNLQNLHLKYQTRNLRTLNIPFQNQPRLHFAHTIPYLKHLSQESGLPLTISKSRHNYLMSTPLYVNNRLD